MLVGLNQYEQAAVHNLDKKNKLEKSDKLFVGFETKVDDIIELFFDKNINEVYFLFNGSSEVSKYLMKNYPSKTYTFDKDYCTDAVVEYQKYWINKLSFGSRIVSWGSGRIPTKFIKKFPDTLLISVRKYLNNKRLPDIKFDTLIINSEHPVPIKLLENINPSGLIINTARPGMILYTNVIDFVLNKNGTYITDVDQFNIRSDRYICTPHIAYLSKNSIDKLIKTAIKHA